MTDLTFALGVVIGLVAALLVARWSNRRTYYVPLRMSDAWRRAHAGDPVPDHLR